MQCRNCSVDKPDTEFYFWRPGWCKTCVNAKRKEYRERNIQKYREYNRRSTSRDPVKYAERSAAYNKALRALRDKYKDEFNVLYHQIQREQQREGLEAGEPIIAVEPEPQVEVEDTHSDEIPQTPPRQRTAADFYGGVLNG